MKKRMIVCVSILALLSIFMGCTQPVKTNTVYVEAENIHGTVTLSTNADIPLVAYYTRETINKESVTVRVKGKTSDMDIAHTYEAGYGTEFPIFGLYPDYENTVVIIDSNVTFTVPVKTETLPEGAPINTSVTDNLNYAPDAFNQDLYWINGWVTENNDFGTITYDRKGEVRYYHLSNAKGEPARVAYKDGIIQLQDSSGIYTLTDKKAVSLDETAHHDMIVLKNGNYVTLAESTWGSEDRVVEYRTDGTVVKDKTFGSLFRDIVNATTAESKQSDLEILNKIIFDDDNIYEDENGVQKLIDWAHANSLVYDEEIDSMYFSLRCQGVIAVDYSEWKLLWWMADSTLKTREGIGKSAGVPYPEYTFHDIQALEPYQVKGAGLDDGPKNQHALFLHKNGSIAMFDNAGDEVSNAEGSRYVEYIIKGSQGNWSADKVEEYRDSNLYSRITSDVDFTGDGNLLILWGTQLIAKEIDFENELKNILFSIEILDPHRTFYYRIDKMPLYPYQDKNKNYAVDNNEKIGY